MAIVTWRHIVDRARVYVADDHDERQGFLKDGQWLDIARVEYEFLYRRWIRNGLVRPAQISTEVPAGQYTVTLPLTTDVAQGRPGVYAIIGVAENMNSYFRMLVPAQGARGAYPFWVAPGEINQGKSTSWAATGVSDQITVELSPRYTGSSYFVRWVAIPPLPQNLDDQVEIPFGCDERLVLGCARRALLKDSGASQLLERLIVESDAEIQFAAHGRLDSQGPRVRRVHPDFHRRRWPQLGAGTFPTDPNYWIYP